jgi:hypothetical protein
VILLLAADAASAAPAEVPSAAATASFHFRRGLELADRRLYEAALHEFRQAYELSPRFQVLYNIAQTERILARTEEAAEHFRRYLAEGGDAIDTDRRREVEEILDQLQPRAKAAPAPPPLTAVASPPAKRLPAIGPVPIGAPLVGSPAPSPPESKVGLWTAGVTTGVLASAAAGLFLWNHQRYLEWRDENAALKAVIDPPGASAGDLLERQNTNDSLWQSVRRWDQVTLGIAAGAAASGALTTWLWLRARPHSGQPRVHVGGGSALFAWNASW